MNDEDAYLEPLDTDDHVDDVLLLLSGMGLPFIHSEYGVRVPIEYLRAIMEQPQDLDAAPPPAEKEKKKSSRQGKRPPA